MNRIKMMMDSFNSKEEFLLLYRRNRQIEEDYRNGAARMKTLNDKMFEYAKEKWELDDED